MRSILIFQIFAALDRVGPRWVPGSGAAIEIDTHWLGGRRHYGGLWEIADIGLVIALRRGGRLLWRKVALLQSKRLYSREIAVVELERSDYQIGIGRLVDRTENIPPLTRTRGFHFTPECVYAAMRTGDKQVEIIERYSRERDMPVHYSFYNPPTMPYQGAIPRTARTPLEEEEVLLGCRVMKAEAVHAALNKLPIGRTPQFKEMTLDTPLEGDHFGDHGWRLEDFVADEVLPCREGRLFEKAQDPDLYALLYQRDQPIASLIQVTIDLPGEGKARKGTRLITPRRRSA